ncbi:GL17325 [Drosophila persimilis]|uniref:GL17325 n=1 Tax=Drosophila persimilis TaxID=7234 RepID=B4HCX7_DROPE|nr:GL17325 [Drosophila persimilis]
MQEIIEATVVVAQPKSHYLQQGMDRDGLHKELHYTCQTAAGRTDVNFRDPHRGDPEYRMAHLIRSTDDRRCQPFASAARSRAPLPLPLPQPQPGSRFYFPAVKQPSTTATNRSS